MSFVLRVLVVSLAFTLPLHADEERRINERELFGADCPDCLNVLFDLEEFYKANCASQPALEEIVQSDPNFAFLMGTQLVVERGSEKYKQALESRECNASYGEA